MSDTIVAAIITGLCSLIVGFISGYQTCKINYNKKVMKQKAGNNSTQIQMGDINVK